MSSGSFTKFRRSWLFWEILALVILVGTVAAVIATPLYDEFLLRRDPEEIVIRMYIKESGGYDPDVITVSRGKLVRLILISMDMVHSLAIPELDVNSGPVQAGKRKVVEFIPLEPGVYNFHCITSCSPKHIFMNGELVVT